MKASEVSARAMPTGLAAGRSPAISACSASNATYGARTKNWIATRRCARRSACSDSSRRPLNRHTITRLAKPSIAESSPKPTSATDPATSPAAIATAPSNVM